jgi:ABC-type glycerol-3-phosphate transport system permease component
MTRKYEAGAKVSAYLILGVAAFLSVGPFVFLLNTSLHHTYTLASLLSDFFRRITFRNYGYLLFSTLFLRWLLNSAIVTAATIFAVLFIDSLAGYTFAKKTFPGKDFIFYVLLATLMVPLIVTFLPIYLTISRLRLSNTYFGLVLPALASPVGVFMMRQYMETIPSELMEAARIDGTSEFKIYSRIILPICRSPLAMLAIYTFLVQWNNFLWPLIVTTTKDMYTLTVGLSSIPVRSYTDWGLATACAVLSVGPILLLFLLFQTQFIEGMTGSVYKG